MKKFRKPAAVFLFITYCVAPVYGGNNHELLKKYINIFAH
jgi:hypothetical protein